jgi:hypothetical protein
LADFGGQRRISQVETRLMDQDVGPHHIQSHSTTHNVAISVYKVHNQLQHFGQTISLNLEEERCPRRLILPSSCSPVSTTSTLLRSLSRLGGSVGLETRTQRCYGLYGNTPSLKILVIGGNTLDPTSHISVECGRRSRAGDHPKKKI